MLLLLIIIKFNTKIISDTWILKQLTTEIMYLTVVLTIYIYLVVTLIHRIQYFLYM